MLRGEGDMKHDLYDSVGLCSILVSVILFL